MFVTLSRCGAQDQRRRGDRAAAPEARPICRASACFCNRAGLRIGGRSSAAQYQYTLQSDSVKELNQWAPMVFQKLRSLPELADVNTDQQDKGLAATLVIDRATAGRFGNFAADHRRHAVRRLRPAPGLHHVHAAESVSRGDGGGPEVLAESGRTEAISTSRSNNGGQVPLSAFTHYVRDDDAALRESPGTFPFGHDFVQSAGRDCRWARRCRRSSRRARNRTCRPTIHGSFQGTAQAYQESLASEPILIAAALIDGLHRAGRAV